MLASPVLMLAVSGPTGQAAVMSPRASILHLQMPQLIAQLQWPAAPLGLPQIQRPTRRAPPRAPVPHLQMQQLIAQPQQWPVAPLELPHMQRPIRREPPRIQPAAQARQAEQQLFRHRFLIGNDMVIRLPLDGVRLLRQLVKERDSAGVLQTQVEAFRPRRKLRLSADASRMLMLPNAGGSSQQSEVLSLEVLARSFGAQLEMTEMELRYSQPSKITDFAVTIFGEHAIGVSVTRAINWPQLDLTADDAYKLLYKKLDAILVSSGNVLNYQWRKQLLHVWARSFRDAQLLEEQYERIPVEVRGNSVVVITLCNGMDWIW
mmetsp:Transcript_37649/g.120967  ORF Transcript_37649/g.120967 Transcript_37649/m.120967 type:complete len:319 (+) Transcript_37649:27-983(+)